MLQVDVGHDELHAAVAEDEVRPTDVVAAEIVDVIGRAVGSVVCRSEDADDGILAVGFLFNFLFA